MVVASPHFAIVRPRVAVSGSGEPRLLEDVVAELADDMSAGVIRITGGPGSGKSTALAHLAAVFAGDDRIKLLDDPQPGDFDETQNDVLYIVAVPYGGNRGTELILQPWGRDELIEYLLAKHHDACGGVIRRLGAAARKLWPPQLAAVVLDRYAANCPIADPAALVAQHIYELLPTESQRTAARSLCLSVLRRQTFGSAAAMLAKSSLPPDALKFLRHTMVQLPLATDQLVSSITRGELDLLAYPIPPELLALTGARLRDDRKALQRLRHSLEVSRDDDTHPMAASILAVADPAWKPAKRPKLELCWRLSQGVFNGVRWPNVDLFGAVLTHCDFRNADLVSSILEHGTLDRARFDGAKLQNARLKAASAINASFCGANLAAADLYGVRLNGCDFSNADLSKTTLSNANLMGANLTSAVLHQAELSRVRLGGAILRDADFTGAVLREANLAHIDLRRAIFDSACLEQAVLVNAQMENLRIVGAQLRAADLSNAHLTGSWFVGADLERANLTGAGLAEIDWEGANLRGANLAGVSFHMGSSRSGLVDSPYACEGSKTGFYTDDFDDMTFKHPEEVRKANLRGADLRGAHAPNVDFYLVDLRDARLDPALREQARQTGAILADFAE